MEDPAIKRFLESPTSRQVDSEQMTDCFHAIAKHSVPDSQIAAFLTRLHETHKDRDPRVLELAVCVMRQYALAYPQQDSGTEPSAILVDIVGTGGDGHNTFNVSTTAGIIASGSFSRNTGRGVRVVKHGNKASTSASGSADILASYGCNLLISPPQVSGITSAFLFLLAPIWHPALAAVAPVRKSLKHPTIFNILGPLLNPAPIEARVIGVHSYELGMVFAETFKRLQPKGRCMIVCGFEGLDEISPAGETHTWTYSPTPLDQEIRYAAIEPGMFGLERHGLESVMSGTPLANARTLKSLLDAELKRGEPVLDYVLINCAALLVIAGIAEGWEDGVLIAEDAITSGRAKFALEEFRKQSSSLLSESIG